MKRFFAVILIIISSFILVSLTGCSKSVSFTYLATEGGFIVGEARQSIPEGETGSEVEAIAKEGYYFVGWDDGKSETKRSDVVSGDIPSDGVTYVAKFERLLNVEYKSEAGGYIVGQTVQSLVEGGTGSEVEAVAKEGYYFTGWDDGKTEAKRSDTLSVGAVYTATFAKLVSVEYTAEAGGYIVGQTVQSLVEGGTGSEVEAVAKEGYYFTGWDDGKTEAKRSDTLSADAVYTATFAKLVSVEYTAEAGGYIVGRTVQSLVEGGTGSEVEAVAKEGYYFTGWDDGKTEAKRSDTADENVSNGKIILTASFAKYIIIKYEASVGGAIAGESSQSLKRGATGSEVEAVAKEGYRFTGWGDDKSSANRVDTASTEDMTFTAYFERVYQVTFVSNNSDGGSIQGDTTQYVSAEETTITVQALPALGYRFTGWSNGTDTEEISLQTSQDVVLIANFEIEALGLPIVEIETENRAPVLDKDNYVQCMVSIGNTDFEYRLDHAEAKIKGRGNTTMGYAKKPYKVKFTSKQDLFGFGEAKTWVLLAEFLDGSMMRNRLAFSCGALLGLEETSHSQPVEIYFNGRYDGVYLLCEQTEAGKTRVNISEDIAEGDEQAFLVELDNRAPSEGEEGLDWFTHVDDVGIKYFAVKSPETDGKGYTRSVTENIARIISDVWDVVCSGEWAEIENRIDVESFAKTCIIHQLFKTYDVVAFSWFLYKEAGAESKVKSGPIWDFDLSSGLGDAPLSGATQVVDPEALWPTGESRANRWYMQLLKHDEFKATIKSLLESYGEKIVLDMEEKVQEAKDNAVSYYRNYSRWNNLAFDSVYIPNEIRELSTWEEHVDWLVAYLKKSLQYIMTYYEAGMGV